MNLHGKVERGWGLCYSNNRGMAMASVYRIMMIEGLSFKLSQNIMKGGHSMLDKNTEIVVSEKKVTIKDEVRAQFKLYTKECIQSTKKPLEHLAESFIERIICWVIDAVG